MHSEGTVLTWVTRCQVLGYSVLSSVVQTCFWLHQAWIQRGCSATATLSDWITSQEPLEAFFKVPKAHNSSPSPYPMLKGRSSPLFSLPHLPASARLHRDVLDWEQWHQQRQWEEGSPVSCLLLGGWAGWGNAPQPISTASTVPVPAESSPLMTQMKWARGALKFPGPERAGKAVAAGGGWEEVEGKGCFSAWRGRRGCLPALGTLQKVHQGLPTLVGGVGKEAGISVHLPLQGYPGADPGFGKVGCGSSHTCCRGDCFHTPLCQILDPPLDSTCTKPLLLASMLHFHRT